jgi:hypothetical protein
MCLHMPGRDAGSTPGRAGTGAHDPLLDLDGLSRVLPGLVEDDPAIVEHPLPSGRAEGGVE